MDVLIRQATVGDLRQVQHLNHELFLLDAKHFNDLNTDWPYEDGEKYFRKRIVAEDGICIVAEQGGKLVGYVAGGWSHTNFNAYRGKRAELENICVTAALRSQGIGSRLVQALYEWCRQHGADYVLVDVYAQNVEAHTFYEKNGFEPYSNTLWYGL